MGRPRFELYRSTREERSPCSELRQNPRLKKVREFSWIGSRGKPKTTRGSKTGYLPAFETVTSVTALTDISHQIRSSSRYLLPGEVNPLAEGARDGSAFSYDSEMFLGVQSSRNRETSPQGTNYAWFRSKNGMVQRRTRDPRGRITRLLVQGREDNTRGQCPHKPHTCESLGNQALLSSRQTNPSPIATSPRTLPPVI